MIELLAPAGTFDAFKAAVSSGADAVYLGGNRFGARHFAGNFDDPTMKDAVAYAHLRGVKVYITVNTLIHDSEVIELIHYLGFLSDIGVDAIIIQDLAVLSLARELFAGISRTPSLHASTQMAIHNLAGARYAIDHHCSRIVLARELSSMEVRSIADFIKPMGGEVEIFGHGALCYAYSGQCLLSAVIGGRSGNRGMCAQPCRKPYQLHAGIRDLYGRMCQDSSIPLKELYLLSTRDLSVYPVLSSILSLPISSLKIEGRMRSPEYVATVTRIYRRAIDDVSLHGGFVPTSEEESDLSLAFSRGFTSGYVNDEEFQSVMGRDLPGRRGLLVGIVRETDTRGNIILEPAGDLVPKRGDGLVCVGGREEQGFVLRYEPTFRGSLLVLEAGISSRRGDRVYLTSRGRINREHEELLKNPDYRYDGSLPLQVSVTIHQDGIIVLTGFVVLRNAEKIAFSYQSKEMMSPARSRPLTTETIASSMQKTGGTLFTIQSLDISCPDNLFAPVSVLNSIRRELLEVVSEHIIESSHPLTEDAKTIRNHIDSLIQKYQNPKDPEGNQHQDLSLIVIVTDLASAISACEAGAERAYIEWYPVLDKVPSGIAENIEASHLSPQLKEQIGIKFPKIVRQKELDIMLSLLPRLISSGVTHIMVDGLGIAEEIAHTYPDLHLSGYTGFNITNHIALSLHQNLAFTTLSCELSGKEITETMRYARNAGLSKPVGILVQGLLEAVITEDRLETLSGSDPSRDVLMIKDQKGESFPIMTDPYGRTHIFNAAETSLLDRIPEILNAGIHYGIIDGRWRSAAYARDMTKLWKKATAGSCNTQQKNQVELWRNEAKGYAWGSLTSATWKRGLCSEFSLSDTKQKRRQ